MPTEALDKYINNQTPQNGSELYEQLKQYRFNIKDVDVTSRVFTHWRKFNLIPMMPVGTWVNLDVFQFVWVQIIKDLREFNLNLETIAKVRDELFETIKFDKSDYFTSDGKVKELAKEQASQLFGIDSFTEFEEALEQDPQGLDPFFDNFRVPFFVTLLLGVFYRQADCILVVGADGRVEIASEEEWSKDYAQIQETFNYQPLITIALKKYLLQLTSDVKLVSRVEQMNILNNVELEVLRTMRSGKVQALKLIFSSENPHTDLVYTFKGMVPEKDMVLIMDRFRGKKHVELTMKTNDGKTVAYEYQARKRIVF